MPSSTSKSSVAIEINSAGTVTNPEIPLSFHDLPPSLQKVFAIGGPLAFGNPHYRMRDGQLRAVKAIWDALHRPLNNSARHVMVEAPCGTGKSLAYLIPALQTGKRILVVTANKNLQNQLIKKDLPFLLGPDGGDGSGVLGTEQTYAILKGVSNYVCERDLGKAHQEGLFADYGEEGRALADWAQQSEDGDKDGLEIPAPKELWESISTSSDSCEGKKCKLFRHCRAMQATREIIDYPAEEGYRPIWRDKLPDVVVTNYDRFFLQLDRFVEAFNIIIFDEAHEAADKARTHFGFDLYESTTTHIAGTARAMGAPYKKVILAATTFFDALRGDATYAGDKDNGGERRVELEPIKHLALPLAMALEEMQSGLSANQRADKAFKSLDAYIKRLNRLATEDLTQYVGILDTTAAGRAVLKVKYLLPSTKLAADLFKKPVSVVLVSATLTPAPNDFGFLREELGLPQAAAQLTVASPFNFREQVRVIVPKDFADHNSRSRAAQVADMIDTILDQSNGRLMALFKSNSSMKAAFKLLRKDRSYPARMQTTEQSTADLVATQRRDKGVLFGVDSFWTGVDIPGDALSVLVIDKLPFPRPNEPIIQALSDYYTNRGANSFSKVTLPRMLMQLRQGIGRLIRTETDKGILVCLDPRLWDGTKYYNRIAITALGNGDIQNIVSIRHLEEIATFLPAR